MKQVKKYYKVVRDGLVGLESKVYFSAVVNDDWIKQTYLRYNLHTAKVGGFFVFDNLEDAIAFAQAENKDLVIFECAVYKEIENVPYSDLVFCHTSYADKIEEEFEVANKIKSGLSFYFPPGTKCFKKIRLTNYVCDVRKDRRIKNGPNKF